MSKKVNGSSRRDFMRNAGKVAAGVTAATAAAKTARAGVYKSILPQSIIGANEIIRTGHIGTGRMGKGNLKYVLGRDDMMPIAVCDIYEQNKMQAFQWAQSKNPNATNHHRYEEIIENKDVDAVIVSTSDHWHALPVIQACDAKKAVYCEKPMTTTILEAKHVLEAAKRNNTVFQGGILQRSGTAFQEAVKLVSEKHLGEVFHVDTWYHDGFVPPGIGKPADGEPPAGCDWTLHQGWVQNVPFNENRWLYTFRFFLDYAGGRLTDWGVHLVDIAMWALGPDVMPKSVVCQGGKLVVTDNRTTPDTFDATWDYGKYTISFTHRACNAYPESMNENHGIIFYGTKGTLKCSRAGYQILPQERKLPSGEVRTWCENKEVKEVPDLYVPHFENFALSIQGKAETISHAQALYNSTVACHMATCAYQANGKLFWDNEKQEFAGGDPVATQKGNEWANRPYLNGYKLI